ncbi:maleate cis-trans isomerase family protein [Spelaeicoccus albus]|uniref:Maleate cis-trans isomerase n=1 Tax=Spelaeicoccus albus TaxID=1280376 RepID=A0A7Z0D1R4_9MICO|nr:maleate cis-trans isomerase [Spelaeicoccus albus]NYI66640.1 maleate cis-trans isomerase [Spelaeicoccus albus]
MTRTTHSSTVGLLYPGIGADDDFSALESRLKPTLRLPLVVTEGGDVAHTPEALRAVGAAKNLADGVAKLLVSEPDSVMWTCTSGSFVFGWRGAHDQAREVAHSADRPASSTSIAFAEAARSMNFSRVAIAASYPVELASYFRRFLADAGVEVVGMTSNEIANAGLVGRLNRDQIVAMAVAADRPNADAVLIPDTAMHSLDWITDLESALGKPVLTANQVTVWEGLRIAGRLMPIDGLGTLFAE